MILRKGGGAKWFLFLIGSFVSGRVVRKKSEMNFLFDWPQHSLHHFPKPVFTTLLYVTCRPKFLHKPALHTHKVSTILSCRPYSSGCERQAVNEPEFAALLRVRTPILSLLYPIPIRIRVLFIELKSNMQAILPKSSTSRSVTKDFQLSKRHRPSLGRKIILRKCAQCVKDRKKVLS